MNIIINTINPNHVEPDEHESANRFQNYKVEFCCSIEIKEELEMKLNELATNVNFLSEDESKWIILSDNYYIWSVCYHFYYCSTQ